MARRANKANKARTAGKSARLDLEEGLVQLTTAKGVFLRASREASKSVRSCAGCDAPCCRVGHNSMRVTRLEALALAKRLEEPDLAPQIPEILTRAKRVARERGLENDPDATYDCPLQTPEGLCLVHGPSQPTGCLTFRPVDDGGCDHDLDLFRRHHGAVEAVERKTLGRNYDALPIPVALLKVLRRRRGAGGPGRPSPSRDGAS